MTPSERQTEDPHRTARIKRWFYVGLTAVALAEIFLPLVFYLLQLTCDVLSLTTWAAVFDVDAPHFWFESLPAWGSIYGLVSCVAIIVVSKFLGKAWLMRREEYYES